jgi:hypothetical protein
LPSDYAFPGETSGRRPQTAGDADPPDRRRPSDVDGLPRDLG